MITRKHIRSLFAIILMMSSIPVNAQKDCTVPAASLFTLVSVQPESGYSELSWNLSPSPDIAAYIIYNHNSGYWYAIDTLWDPLITSYLYNSTGTKYFSESYVVAAFRKPICASPLSNVLSTIYCTSQIDTCKKLINIKWNRYTGYPLRVLEYRIMVSKNGSPLTETYTVDSLSGSFSLSDFDTDTQYCFAVRAELEGGAVSNSNKSCIQTKMQRAPQWINADYATVTNDGKIDLSFTYDQLSEISHFSLERKIGATGSYQTIAEPGITSGSLKYTDNNADIHKVNHYRIAAINNCNLPVVYSNEASNIVLALDKNQNIINLSWNPYRQWNGIIATTKVVAETGDGSSENFDAAAGDSLANINYSDLMYKVTGNEACFTVESTEASNPYGAAGISISNRVCTPVTELINVPNTFTPDHNLKNDTFRPVLSFTPSIYKLVITDLKRRILFETSEPSDEWDGTLNGKALPEGVYLWFLKVTTASGKTILKTGTVNLIFNP
jgi:gliding motility-associated-like protein